MQQSGKVWQWAGAGNPQAASIRPLAVDLPRVGDGSEIQLGEPDRFRSRLVLLEFVERQPKHPAYLRDRMIKAQSGRCRPEVIRDRFPTGLSCPPGFKLLLNGF